MIKLSLILVSSVIVLLGSIQSNFILFSSPSLYAQEEQLRQYSFTDKWDSKGSEDGQLKNPHSIDIDSNGVADSGNNRIQKFSEAGKFITK